MAAFPRCLRLGGARYRFVLGPGDIGIEADVFFEEELQLVLADRIVVPAVQVGNRADRESSPVFYKKTNTNKNNTMKAIKTPEQHAAALKRVAELARRFNKLPANERDELEVLNVLIQRYENDNIPIPPPTPLEAIRFRMLQMGYKRKDLGELLGGASRASEILSGKRHLSQEMMRRLRDEWGIPADSLLGPSEPDLPPDNPPDGSLRDSEDYPMKQMYDRGYFDGSSGSWRADSKDKRGLLARFFAALPGGMDQVPAFARQGGGEKAKVNPHALEAWRVRVLLRAARETEPPPWDPLAVDADFLRWLAGLSYLADGPRLACGALLEKGIAVIIEPRLDHTHLDGSALLGAGCRPVIGLTLRQDRLDNFWFTLFHEIGHVLLHLSAENPVIYDVEIDRRRTGRIEQEADHFALDTPIPPEKWEEVKHLHYAKDIRAAASRLRVGAAVIAGRLRREANDYRLHKTLVGYGEAREALGFSKEDWPK